MFKCTFLAVSVDFHHKICFFHFLFFFFRWSIKFPQQKVNQSEIGKGDKKVSMEIVCLAKADSALKSIELKGISHEETDFLFKKFNTSISINL